MLVELTKVCLGKVISLLFVDLSFRESFLELDASARACLKLFLFNVSSVDDKLLHLSIKLLGYFASLKVSLKFFLLTKVYDSVFIIITRVKFWFLIEERHTTSHFLI